MRKYFLLAVCLAWTAIAFGVGDGNLHIYFLDVGQGDASLVIGPDGTSCIIDGGPSNDTTPYVAAMQNAISRGLTDNTLDYIMVTHFHTDHLMALDEFHTLYPGGLIWSYDRGGSYSSTAFTQYDNYFGTSGLNKRRIAETFSLGSATMTYLGRGGSGSTSDENNNGVIYRLDFLNFQCWFGGDLGYEYEAPKGQAAGDVDVYQVNHHGSSTSSQQTFLSYILPEAHVFSYGIPNSYGHPTDAAIDRLNAIGSYRFDTPLDNYQANPYVYCVTDGATYFEINGVDFSLGGGPTPTPTATPTATPTPTPTPSGDVFVYDINVVKIIAGKNIFADATIWIKDDYGNDIYGATVTGDWSDAVSGTSSGITGADGKVTLSSPKTKQDGTFIFCVTDVVASGYTYNPAKNIETCDSSEGGSPTPTPTPTPTSTPTSTPTPTPTPTGTPSGKVYVNDITMGAGSAGVNYFATAAIWIKNDSGADVPDATVTGEWSDAVTGTSSGVTGSDGKVTLQSPNKKKGGTFTFCVTDVVASGYIYDPSMNAETCDTITNP